MDIEGSNLEDTKKSSAPVVAELFRTSNAACSTILPSTHRTLTTNGTDCSLLMPDEIPDEQATAKKELQKTINLTTVKTTKAELPKVMQFVTWWTEEGKRKHMNMDYFPESKTWNVKVDIPMPCEVYGRDGELLEAWDLHVGAKINILGRQVTLQQASLPTLNWLDRKAKLLIKKKLSLEAELSKFTHIKFTQTTHTSQHLEKTSATPHKPLGGKVNLRGLKNEVEVLKEKLEQYKPTPVVPDPEAEANQEQLEDDQDENEDGNENEDQ